MFDQVNLSPDRPDDEPAPNPTDHEASLVAAYGELQNLLLATPEVIDFLDGLATLATSVSGASWCAITLQRDGHPITVGCSDPLASKVDEIQYGQDCGPCLEALRTGTEISVTDLASEQRWGDYPAHALAQGVCSSLSLPLTINDLTIGAMNVYSRRTNAFAPGTSATLRDFARQAAITISLALQRADQVTMEGQMRDALATRALIDQALGIIMGQQKITSTEAFAVLRKASQEQNRKMHEVAGELIVTVTGHQPQPPRPFIPAFGGSF